MSYMSDLDILRHEAGIDPIPSRSDRMTADERAISDRIGPAFWVEDGAIGVIDNRDPARVDRMLKDASRALSPIGYRTRFLAYNGLMIRLTVYRRASGKRVS